MATDTRFFIEWDASDFDARVAALGKALPYVEAAANSKMAVSIRDQTRADLHKSFTLRNNWSLKSIRVGKWGTKTDPTATVGSTEGYLRRHINGGTFTASNFFAVNNSRGFKGKKGGGAGPMRSPESYRGRNLKLGPAKRFFELGASAGKRSGLWKRAGGKSADKRTVVNYFRYTKSITMKARWPFYEQAKAQFRKEYTKFWVEATRAVLDRFAAKKGRR